MTRPAQTQPLTEGYELFLRQISQNDPSSAHAHFARAALDAHIAGDAVAAAERTGRQLMAATYVLAACTAALVISTVVLVVVTAKH